MKIAVCVKQVPTGGLSIDSVKGTLIRESGGARINPDDLNAIEMALGLKDTKPETAITVLSMGPRSAEEVIRYGIAMGADNGALLSDTAFGGSDVRATACVLRDGIRTLGGFDLIICGERSSDGGTGLLGAALAKTLSLPHAGDVCGIDGLDEKSISFSTENDEKRVRFSMPLPALLIVKKDALKPRLPSLRHKLAARQKEITLLGAGEIGNQREQYGQSGSRTRVRRLFPPQQVQRQKPAFGDPDALTDLIIKSLSKLGQVPDGGKI